MEPVPFGFARVVLGSNIVICAVAVARVWLKSPTRSRSVGTVVNRSEKLRSRSPSYAPIKKVLFLITGPLTIPPNWFRLKLASGVPR